MVIISAVVAMSENRVIGKDNGLPWKLPEDLKRFRALTTGYPIIMGRKTFDSIGRALPGRTNIVISRQKNYLVPGGLVAPNLDAALKLGGSAQNAATPIAQVFVIGGAEIYRLALPYLDRIYLTQIHQNIEGDAFFPEFTSFGFNEVSREVRSEPFPFSFLEYRR